MEDIEYYLDNEYKAPDSLYGSFWANMYDISKKNPFYVIRYMDRTQEFATREIKDFSTAKKFFLSVAHADKTIRQQVREECKVWGTWEE